MKQLPVKTMSKSDQRIMRDIDVRAGGGGGLRGGLQFFGQMVHRPPDKKNCPYAYDEGMGPGAWKGCAAADNQTYHYTR